MGRPDSGKNENASGRGNNQRRKPNRPASQKQKSSGSQKKGGSLPGIRLNKYIANSGICSRREADMYISVGQVTVNGKVINEMGHRVMPSDEVKFDGRRISPEPPAYVLLNKPKGVATTTSESKGLTVMDIIASATASRVKPFGRLGRNATGFIIVYQ